LYKELDLSLRVLRDFVSEETKLIHIDSREQFEVLLAFSQKFMPNTSNKLQHYIGDNPLFDLCDADKEIKAALSKRVNLKSGGYLIIDQTEALTTIDVNTGGFVGLRNFEDTIFKTNLEASLVIARQLRLRNLGGIIVIDFIDMNKSEHCLSVLAELSKQLQKDYVRTTIGSFSELGLLEMTRKRTRDSLANTLCEPCHQCQGGGRVKTSATVAYEILREILRETKQFNPKEIRVIASPAVIELFLEEESANLALLSEFIHKPISLQSETAMGQEQYDIVLF
jgi:ribonuclease G